MNTFQDIKIHPYIEVNPPNDFGGAWIKGTSIRVGEVAAAFFRHRERVEKVVAQWPELSPAQVFAAIAYYFAYKAEIDQFLIDSKSIVKDENATAYPKNTTPLKKQQNHPLITSDPGYCGGSPRIVGTRTPVRSIVTYFYELHYGIKGIVNNLPYLKPTEVCAALAYYYDFKDQVDLDIYHNSEEYLMKIYPPGKYELCK